MKWFFKRMTEASSMAGTALLRQNLLPFIASGCKDVNSGVGVLAGIASILVPEKGNVETHQAK